MKPQARREGLVLRELPDELLVYDTTQHRAHCLNRTAADVFRHADGTRTVSDLGRLVVPAADPAEGEEAVRLAVERLGGAGLLEGGLPVSSRREFVRRVGIGAAILLPAVVSILAPTPAEAAVSNCVDGPDCSIAANAGLPCSCTGDCSVDPANYICNGGTLVCDNPDCP